MANIKLTSKLDCNFRENLERLLFFNPQQKKVLSGIINSIEAFGAPHISEENNLLRIRVEGLQEVQTLYALQQNIDSDELIGVVIYVRIDKEDIVILHIGIRDDYSANGKNSGQLLFMKLISELRKLASRIKGVRHLYLMYSKNGDLTKIVV